MNKGEHLRRYESILEAIGWTPLVRLSRVCKGVKAKVYAKVEFFNPGGSVKDRIGISMIERAEKEGKLKPGGVVIESTSGNTGIGLAIACALKGYKLICTVTDKQSKEKLDVLRAFGAEVIVCPTNVPPEDERSYYSVARRLAQTIPDSVYVNQYTNPANPQAHYLTTGPEIWEQTEGRITHLVCGVGTGGTISGAGKFLKEKKPDIKIWGVDPYGSVFTSYFKYGKYSQEDIYPYLIEGIGEDIIPETVDFSVIDDFIQVTDRDAAIWARRITREEGIFVGYSSGAALCGLMQRAASLTENDFVVVVFPDSGFRNLNKIYNDEWMRQHGFLSPETLTAGRLIRMKTLPLIWIDVNTTLKEAFALMKEKGISQVPVMENNVPVGMLYDWFVFDVISEDPHNAARTAGSFQLPQVITVSEDAPFPEVVRKIKESGGAILVKDAAGMYHILTTYDIMEVAALSE